MAKTHSKLKNSGMLFELLSRQLTSDILQKKESKAINILREHFRVDSELFKELELYQLLTKTKYDQENKAECLISEVLKERKKLNAKKLEEQKYNLVKVIKENYDLETFFNYRVANYKLLASIYKLFEGKRLPPADVVTAKFTIIENITQKSIQNKELISEIEQQYQELDSATRKLTYKFLVRSFNEKYEGLSKSQKALLSEYVQNISNSPKLTEYVNAQIPKLKADLLKLSKKIKDDEIVQIKINEVCSRLDNLLKHGTATDEHVLSMLRYYQLQSEIQEAIKK